MFVSLFFCVVEVAYLALWLGFVKMGRVQCTVYLVPSFVVSGTAPLTLTFFKSYHNVHNSDS